MIIHETIPVPLEGLPEGTRQNGYEDFVVQELKIEAHNICYRRLRYLLPDGTSHTAPLPAHVQGHFGPGLRSYVVYRQSPTPRRKAGLERDFDRLFTRRTGFMDLNAALKRIHEKRADLLLVLDRPEIPLHNNLSENDIREWAKKRKISAGTRSELGRRCRDTFVSLKKTCRKLGVSFWRYLQDRIRGRNDILALPDLMRQAARQT